MNGYQKNMTKLLSKFDLNNIEKLLYFRYYLKVRVIKFLGNTPFSIFLLKFVPKVR